MPLIVREHLGLIIVLLLSVPLQYYLQNRYGTSSREKQKDAVVYILETVQNYISSWMRWFSELQETIDDMFPDSNVPYDADDDGVEDDPPFKILYNGKPDNSSDGWFASSQKPRRARTPEMTFHVGEVVHNEDEDDLCVVVGWDKEARAPDEWIKQAYPGPREALKKHQVHYTLICDIHDTESLEEIHYKGQSSLRKQLRPHRIINQYVDQFFEDFDEDTGRYIPKSWLKRLYPKDV